MRAALVLLLAFSAAALSSSTASAPRQRPRFEDFATTDTVVPRIAPVQLRDARDRAFRTRLTDGVRRGPNFAGHFTIVTWGCNGTGCVAGVVIDVRTGRVYWDSTPDFSCHDVRFRRLSTLLMELRDVEKERVDCAPQTEHYFSWARDHFVSVP